MTTSLILSFPSPKVQMFFIFIYIFLNFKQIKCLVSTSSVQKGQQSYFDWLVQTSSPTALPSNISEKCYDHTEEYLIALRNRKSWAIKSMFLVIFLKSEITCFD